MSAGLSGAALREAIAVAVHLADVDVAGDAIEQSAVRGRAFVERKAAGDQGGNAFVVLRYQLEQ